MSKIQAPNLVTLEYQISQLPSSQHRAGLAGLILKIQWLQQQAEFKDSIGAICKIIDLDADKATLQFNLAGITLLFRSHYNAVLEERESTKIRPNGSKNYLTIEREVYAPDTDRTELVKSYIYQDLIPTGLLIQSFDPTVKDSQIWTKLWQEATWGVLRPREKQRLPFKAMVGGTDPPEIDRIWQLLRDRPDKIVPLSSTQMLGVQSTNNEGISSTDRGSNYFLLHFWSYVAQIYLPFQVDIKDNVEFHGYAIAIPDVCNLVAFCQHFPAILQQRSTKIRWKKPDGAIVRHPIEVGLFFLRSIHTYLCANTDDLDIGNLLFGVDVFHIFRKKHEPQILRIQRYPPNKQKIEEFTQLLPSWDKIISDKSLLDRLLSG